jgi:hypothetical protein
VKLDDRSRPGTSHWKNVFRFCLVWVFARLRDHRKRPAGAVPVLSETRRPISTKNVPTANTPTHKSSAGSDSTYFLMGTHLYEQFMNLLFEIYWFSYPMIWVE